MRRAPQEGEFSLWDAGPGGKDPDARAEALEMAYRAGDRTARVRVAGQVKALGSAELIAFTNLDYGREVRPDAVHGRN